MDNEAIGSFGRMDRLAVVALILGIAGVIGSVALPPEILDYVSYEVRMVIFIGSGLIFVSGILYLLWDFGRVFRTARIALYGILFVGVVMIAVSLFGGWAWWQRGLVGASIGGMLLIAIPYIYPRIQHASHALHPAEDSAAIAQLAQLGWGVRSDQGVAAFDIGAKEIPSPKESGDYLSKINRPYTLAFGQVPSLAGLHYLANRGDCTELTVNSGEFTDLSELAAFTMLRRLNVSQLPLNSPGVVDGSPLASLTSLTKLNLYSTRVRDTEFLRPLVNLKELYLGSTLINNIFPVSALPAVEALDVRGTRVSDLTPLAHTKSLRDLSIGGAQIPGLVALSDLPNLTKMHLIEPQPFDLGPIKSMSHLKQLVIWGPDYSVAAGLDLAPLGALKELEDLSIRSMGLVLGGRPLQVSNVDRISILSELRSLMLGGLQIDNISMIIGLKHLETLNLQQMPIGLIDPVRTVPTIKKVILIDVPVSDVSPLLALPSLTELTIMRTPARSDVLTELERRGVKIDRR